MENRIRQDVKMAPVEAGRILLCIWNIFVPHLQKHGESANSDTRNVVFAFCEYSEEQ